VSDSDSVSDELSSRNGSPDPFGSSPARLVVLVGPPGAGKSTIGRQLAARWTVPFRDTDTDVEVVAGMSVADIFIECGEAHFRDLERKAVAVALAEASGVLSLGGGAVTDVGTRRALAGHTVVYLDVGLSDAAKRVGLARDRPLLVESPRARLAAMLAERRPLYAEVATVVVDTSGALPGEITDRVDAALKKGDPGRE
jgi:shikimate kinase